MLVTALTLVGYSVGISLVSSGIKKKCDTKAADNIKKKIAVLPEGHTDQEEQDIIKQESIRSVAKYSIATGLVGVAGAVVSTAIICNFDAPKNSTPCICTSDDTPVDIHVAEDSTTVNVDGVQGTSF